MKNALIPYSPARAFMRTHETLINRVTICALMGSCAALLMRGPAIETHEKLVTQFVPRLELIACRDMVAQNRDSEFVPIARIIPSTSERLQYVDRMPHYNPKDNGIIEARIKAKATADAAREKSFSDMTKANNATILAREKRDADSHKDERRHSRDIDKDNERRMLQQDKARAMQDAAYTKAESAERIARMRD